MSNLSELLNIADKNAFSNLYDVTIDSDNQFKLRIESLQIDGYSLDYKMNESTKQYMITKANRPRSIQMSIRESNNYQFLKYLNTWLVHFYNPSANVFIAGAEESVVLQPLDNQTTLTNSEEIFQTKIKRKRPIIIKTWGNTPDAKTPDLTLSVSNAMIEKCPSLSLSWADSKPIVYQVSFVCEFIDYTFGTTALSAIGRYKPL